MPLQSGNRIGEPIQVGDYEITPQTQRIKNPNSLVAMPG